MNVTLNNTAYNRYNNFSNNQAQCKPRPTFKANAQTVTVDAVKEVATDLGSNSSKFFAPFTKMFNSTSDWLCDKVAKPVLGSKWFGGFAEKVQNTGDLLFQHCLTTGSVITSGLYMQRTMTNKNLDKDRRNTLGVNQFLTLLVSTAGAYTLDKYLKTWWENISARYVGLKVLDNNFDKDFKDVNKSIMSLNKELKANPKVDINAFAENAKTTHNMTEEGYKFLTDTLNSAVDAAKENEEPLKKIKTVKLDKFVKKLVKNGRIPQLAEKAQKQVKGMSLLRSMIVFGFVYRYFVPVAVTKPANKLCDMYLEHKKTKQAQSIKRA